MKRGNTALKRVVSVASVAAMAIAGAVLAAPAASAATPSATLDAALARALPTANASALADPVDNAAQYSTEGTTGAVKVIPAGNSGQASNLQIAIPLTGTAAGTDFAANDTISVQLSGATFTQAPRGALSGATSFASLDYTPNGSPFTGTTVSGDAPGVSAIGAVSQTTVANDTVTFTFTKASQATGAVATDAVYVLNVSDILLTVGDAAPAAVTATVLGTTTPGATATTIAYTSPFTVSAASGYPANTKGAIELPAITVTEQTKGAFTNGDDVLFTASGDPATTGGTITLDQSNVKVTPGQSTLGINGAAVGTAYSGALSTAGAGLAGTSTDAIESYTVTGLKVTGLKAGANVTLSLAAPLATGQKNLPAAAKFSLTPANTAGASTVISPSSQVNRIAGDSRYETAAKIADSFVGATNVVLANALDAKAGFDALSANFLAGAKGAPILLTDSSDSLPAATQGALTKVLKNVTGTVTIYIAGKTDSVSAAAEAQAKFLAEAAANAAATVKVVRFDGANRYETSAKIVTEAGSAAIRSFDLGNGLLKTAFLASGAVNADALAAGSLSAGAGLPVLLAGTNGVDPAVVKAIKDLGVKQLIVLGGSDRITDAVADGLKTDAGITSWTRVAGEGTYGRYDTASLLYTTAFAKTADKGLGLILVNATAYLANGSIGFPDALAVGPLAGKGGVVNPLLTVPQDKLTDSTAKFLKDNKDGINSVEALGQSDRIADSVVTDAQKAIL